MLVPGDLDHREQAGVAPGDLFEAPGRRPPDQAPGQRRDEDLLGGDERPKLVGHLPIALRRRRRVGVPDLEDHARVGRVALHRGTLAIAEEGADPALEHRRLEAVAAGDGGDRLGPPVLARLVVAPGGVGFLRGEEIAGQRLPPRPPQVLVLQVDEIVDRLSRFLDQLLRRLVAGDRLFVGEGPLDPPAAFAAHRLRRPHDAGQRVVVGGGNRVELVVVAAGAADRLGQERPPDDVHLLVDDVDEHLVDVLLGQHLRAEGQEPRRGEAREPLVVAGRRHQVAGNLLLHEAVVGLVGVERLDDPVAIAERIGVRDVLVEPVRVGVAGDVEPVPAPAFAVARRREKPLDHPLVGVGPLVGEERVDLGRGRRQAGQVERDPPQQLPPAGGGDRGEPLGLEAGQDEPVDRAAHPGRVVDGGRLGTGHRPERPVLAARTEVVGGAAVGPGGHDRGVGGPRVRRAAGHPALEVGDDRGRQPAVGRHLDRAAVADDVDQQAVVRRAGHDDGAAVAPRPDPDRVDQRQSALDALGVRAVTLVAALGEHRADLRLEVLEVLGRELLRVHRGRDAGGQRQEGAHGAEETDPDRGSMP